MASKAEEMSSAVHSMLPKIQVKASKCAAWSCQNNTRPSKTVAYFNLPAERGRCAIWLLNAGRIDLVLLTGPQLATCVFCEGHFEASQFAAVKGVNVRKLLRNAIPTIFGTQPLIPLHLVRPSLTPLGKPQKQLDFKSCTRPSTINAASVKCYQCGRSYQTHNDITLYFFPVDDQRRYFAWIINSGLLELLQKPKDWVHKNCLLCSEHFEASQFEEENSRHLKAGSIPTLFYMNSRPPIPAPLRFDSTCKKPLPLIIASSKSSFDAQRRSTPKLPTPSSKVQTPTNKIKAIPNTVSPSRTSSELNSQNRKRSYSDMQNRGGTASTPVRSSARDPKTPTNNDSGSASPSGPKIIRSSIKSLSVHEESDSDVSKEGGSKWPGALASGSITQLKRSGGFSTSPISTVLGDTPKSSAKARSSSGVSVNICNSQTPVKIFPKSAKKSSKPKPFTVVQKNVESIKENGSTTCKSTFVIHGNGPLSPEQLEALIKVNLLDTGTVKDGAKILIRHKGKGKADEQPETMKKEMFIVKESKIIPANPELPAESSPEKETRVESVPLKKKRPASPTREPERSLLEKNEQVPRRTKKATISEEEVAQLRKTIQTHQIKMNRQSKIIERLKREKKERINHLSVEQFSRLAKEHLPGFMGTFFCTQLLTNSKSNMHGFRWDDASKIFALGLWNRSPAAFKLMRQAFNMPSIRTLMNWVTSVPRDVDFFQKLKEVVARPVHESEDHISDLGVLQENKSQVNGDVNDDNRIMDNDGVHDNGVMDNNVVHDNEVMDNDGVHDNEVMDNDGVHDNEVMDNDGVHDNDELENNRDLPQNGEEVDNSELNSNDVENIGVLNDVGLISEGVTKDVQEPEMAEEIVNNENHLREEENNLAEPSEQEQAFHDENPMEHSEAGPVSVSNEEHAIIEKVCIDLDTETGINFAEEIVDTSDVLLEQLIIAAGKAAD